MASSIVFAIGSIALLTAMATDFIGVVSRHLGVNALGSAEIVQLCVVGAISASLIIATVKGAHAAVHVVTERLPPTVTRRLAQVSDLLGGLLFLIFAAGSIWLLSDTWPLGERSDVLGLPFGPARIAWCAALLIVAGVFLIRAFRPAPLKPSPRVSADPTDGEAPHAG